MPSSRKTVYALTGGGGFLGWHVKLALHSGGYEFVEIPLGNGFDLERAVHALQEADYVVHLAGINRGTDEDIATGNVRFAEQLAKAVERTERPLRSITYANSTQSGNDTVYGRAKQTAGGLLARAAEKHHSSFRDVVLPNLFGEHGRPFYNSVIATFSHLLATGEGSPSVQVDRELTLLHAQDAADWLVGTFEDAADRFRYATVSELLSRLQYISDTYRTGAFPDLSDDFSRDLFNTYRSFLFPVAIPLRENQDARGSFVELTRSWGGSGQSSYSTTYPKITRGNHYHRRKVERFAVLSGKAEMSLRRMFSEQVISIVADGSPIAVDQPTGWTHNLTNIGDQTLYMFFWTNDIFDPANPDTFAELVR